MYSYEVVRPDLFTEDGRMKLEQMRQTAASHLQTNSTITLEDLIRGLLGDMWIMVACADRMVELGELQEVPVPDLQIGQERTFKRPDWHRDHSLDSMKKFHLRGLYLISGMPIEDSAPQPDSV